jgi:voltage-gated potassium channel
LNVTRRRVRAAIGGVAIVGTASATIVNYLNDRTQRVRQHDETLEEGPRSEGDDGG